jgi:hypothetical protein
MRRKPITAGEPLARLEADPREAEMGHKAQSSTGRLLKKGSMIRVVAVPPAVTQQMPRETQRLFRAMVGRRFKVRAIERQPLLIRLDVSKIAIPLLGGTAHVVFIEPEYVA